jgi:hypothetical protein
VSHKKNEFEYDKIPTDCCGVKILPKLSIILLVVE